MDFPFGPGGDTTWPVKLWRDRKGCKGKGVIAGNWSVTKKDTFTRTNWDNCADGGAVRLDVHQRGHFIPVGWIARQLDELLGLNTAP